MDLLGVIHYVADLGVTAVLVVIVAYFGIKLLRFGNKVGNRFRTLLETYLESAQDERGDIRELYRKELRGLRENNKENMRALRETNEKNLSMLRETIKSGFDRLHKDLSAVDTNGEDKLEQIHEDLKELKRQSQESTDDDSGVQ